MDSKNFPDTQNLFLPDFCDIRVIFIVLVMAELLAFILTISGSTSLMESFSDLALISLFTQWVSLSCLVVLCISRRYLCRLPQTAAAITAYLLILLVASLVSQAAWWSLNPELLPAEVADARYLQFMFRNLTITALVAAITLRYLYVQYQWRQQLQAETRARIQALQSRIRPHFLFNCMNTIASLTRQNPAQAEQAVEDLSDLFRISLGEASRRITLAEELEVCRQYLRIEGLRLNERLQTEWDTDKLPMDALIPALTIQPLLENAIYHGIEPLAEGGRILIRGEFNQGLCRISVENPVTEATIPGHQHGNQLAQDNVQQRLSAYHGNKGQLQIQMDEDNCRYCVTIQFPYVQVEDADFNR